MDYYKLTTDIIEDIDLLYERIGALRDFAEGKEKDVFNDSRGKLGELSQQWRIFRNSLPDERAKKPVNWSGRLKRLEP